MAEYIVKIEDNKISSVIGLVRCKDCKHARKYASGTVICTGFRWAMCHEEDFCSDAELERSKE